MNYIILEIPFDKPAFAWAVKGEEDFIANVSNGLISFTEAKRMCFKNNAASLVLNEKEARDYLKADLVPKSIEFAIESVLEQHF